VVPEVTGELMGLAIGILVDMEFNVFRPLFLVE
jgi:hypothetical protein